jgi:hypothetical protein
VVDEQRKAKQIPGLKKLLEEASNVPEARGV